MPYTGQAHEFSGAVDTSAEADTRKADVNTPSPAWRQMEADRAWPRLLLHDGERGVRAAGEAHLPRFPGEEDTATEYRARLQRSYLVNFYARGVGELVGRMFAKPLILSDDTPERVREWWADIDDNGTQGDLFFQTAAEDAVGQGQTAILPDMPKGYEFTSEAEEERAGVRPRLVHHRAESVIEALPGEAFGMPVVARLRLRRREETVEGYEYDHKDTVREYRMGNPEAWLNAARDELNTRFASFRTHTEPENQADEWTVDDWRPLVPSRKASAAQQRLFLEPLLVPMYAGKLGAWLARPPMLEGATLNRQHWQKKSDIDNQESVSLVPTMDMEGADEEDIGTIHVGAQRVLYHPAGSKASWLTIGRDGAATLDRAHKTLEHLEQHIRAAMLDPMQRMATGKQLATVRLLDESRPMTMAQAMLVNFQWSINHAVAIMCAWVGVDNPGTITFQKDTMMDLADPKADDDLLEMAMADPPLCTPEFFYREKMRRGKFDKDLDLAAEMAALAAWRETAGTAGL